jgi:hypothetical protein
MRDRDGCLEGILKLVLLTALFDWLEDNFGFGRGCSCSGIGCGFLILVIFVIAACGVITGTDWFSLI